MTDASGKNPYRPGVGVRPLYLAGRDAPLRRFDAMLRAAPEQQANMRVTGLRGVGKTVLLETFAEHAQEHDWEPAFMELQPAHNTDAQVAMALGSLLGRTRERLSRIARLRSAAGKALRSTSLQISWEEVSLSVSFGSEREEDLARELFATVQLALAKGRAGVVLLLDEAQLIHDERDRHGEHPLSLLLAPIVALQRQEIPLGLVLCGLPTLTGNLQKARSYSERLFRGEEIDTLAPPKPWRRSPDHSSRQPAGHPPRSPRPSPPRSRATPTSCSCGDRSCGTPPRSPAQTTSHRSCSTRHALTSTADSTATSTTHAWPR